MESIYHVEVDIECRVLHYGKEVCIAKPGVDVSITLRKGKHKLSFVSTENPLDKYSTILAVPENDMEDYIEILLEPIRSERIAQEKKMLTTPFSALKDLFFSLHEKLGPIFREAYTYDQNNWMRFIQRDSRLFPARLEGYAYKHYVDLEGNIAVTTDFYIKFLFHEGVACVGNISHYHIRYDSKHVTIRNFPVCNVGFIDYSGNLTIPCVWKIDRAFGYMGIFSQDRAFVMQNDSSILDELVLEDYHYYDNYINAGSEMTVTPGESRNGIIRYPSIRGNLYYIISKDGTIIKEFKKSNLIPHFNPFRQGLSVILWTRVEDGEDPFVQKKQYISLIEVVDRKGNIVISLDQIPEKLEYDDLRISIFTGMYAYVGCKELKDKYYLSIEYNTPKIVLLEKKDQPDKRVTSSATWYYKNIFIDQRWNRFQYERPISRYNHKDRQRDINFLSEDRNYLLSTYAELKPDYPSILLSIDEKL